MNRGELKTRIKEYVHRDDGDDLLNTWIDAYTDIIGRELRDKSNSKRADFTPTARISDLPSDFRALERISRAGENGGWIKLQAGGAMTHAFGNDGDAHFYSLPSGNEIEIYPYVAGTYELVYYFTPAALTTDSSENAVLTAWPLLYIYGVAMESAVREQDGELYALLRERAASEVSRINAAHQRGMEGMQMEAG